MFWYLIPLFEEYLTYVFVLIQIQYNPWVFRLQDHYRRSYLFHGAIEDCVADEIIMRNDIHKDMNIDYAA